MYLQADEFLDTLCGHGREGGKRWRLVFNAGAHSFSLAWPHHATGGLVGNQALHSVSQAPLCHGECGREVHTDTCTRSPGKDQVNEAAKGGKGGGLYFPLTAVQVGRPCRHAASRNAPYMHSLLLLLTACLSVSGFFQRTILQWLHNCALVALVDTLQGLSWQSLSIIIENKLTRARRAMLK